MEMRSRGAREAGAVAIEMALVLPILLVLVFGIIEFGILFNRYNAVAHAAREGVRRLSVGVDAVTAESAAEGSAPELVSEIDCTASTPSGGDVQMVCSSLYDLAIWVIEKPLTVKSTAVMRKE